MVYLTYPDQKWRVICPMINRIVSVGDCADYCNYYEGDGRDDEGMECSFK